MLPKIAFASSCEEPRGETVCPCFMFPVRIKSSVYSFTTLKEAQSLQEKAILSKLHCSSNKMQVKASLLFRHSQGLLLAFLVSMQSHLLQSCFSPQNSYFNLCSRNMLPLECCCDVLEGTQKGQWMSCKNKLMGGIGVGGVVSQNQRKKVGKDL